MVNQGEIVMSSRDDGEKRDHWRRFGGTAGEIGSISGRFHTTYFTGSIDDVKLLRDRLRSAQLLQLASGL